MGREAGWRRSGWRRPGLSVDERRFVGRPTAGTGREPPPPPEQRRTAAASRLLQWRQRLLAGPSGRVQRPGGVWQTLRRPSAGPARLWRNMALALTIPSALCLVTIFRSMQLLTSPALQLILGIGFSYQAERQEIHEALRPYALGAGAIGLLLSTEALIAAKCIVMRLLSSDRECTVLISSKRVRPGRLGVVLALRCPWLQADRREPRQDLNAPRRRAPPGVAWPALSAEMPAARSLRFDSVALVLTIRPTTSHG